MRRTTRNQLPDRLAMYCLWAIFPVRLLAESFTAGIAGGSFLTRPMYWLFSNFLSDTYHILPTCVGLLHTPRHILRAAALHPVHAHPHRGLPDSAAQRRHQGIPSQERLYDGTDILMLQLRHVHRRLPHDEPEEEPCAMPPYISTDCCAAATGPSARSVPTNA